MADIPYKFYKTTVNGVPVYERLPGTNTPFGYSEVTPQEYTSYLQGYRPRTNAGDPGSTFAGIGIGETAYDYYNRTNPSMLTGGSSGIQQLTPQEAAAQGFSQQTIASNQGGFYDQNAINQQRGIQSGLTSGALQQNPNGMGAIPVGSTATGNLQQLDQQNQQQIAQMAKVPVPTAGQVSTTPIGNQTTPSIVDYLASVGKPADFASRKLLANQLGIANYTGTASQNTEMLSKLRQSGGTQGGTSAISPITESGQPGFKSVQDLLTDAMTKLGLTDTQAQVDKLRNEERKLTDEMNQKILDVNNNPWFSQGKRDMETRKVQASYESKLNTLSNFAKYYEAKYETDMATAKFLATGMQEDQQFAINAALKQKDAEAKLKQDGFQNQLDLMKFNEDKRQFNLKYNAEYGGGSDPSSSNLISYAELYASTGKIPTGMPKGSFQQIANLAKELPKPQGSIVNKITGVTDTNVTSLEQQDYVRLNNILKSTQRLKELDKNRWGGVVSGTLGKIFGDQDQTAYLAVRKSIIDDMQRMQSGAALTAEETAFYADYLPNRFSEKFFLGADSMDKINNFENIINNRLRERLDTNNLSMVGYSTVNLGGKNYTVGSTIEVNGIKGRVNADGSITLI